MFKLFGLRYYRTLAFIFLSLFYIGGMAAVAPVDSTPPTVQITTPLDNATVVGKIPISASASDDSGVVFLLLFVDSTNIAGGSGSPLLIEWDSTTVPNGFHTITAEAVDGSDNFSRVSITINVDNPTIAHYSCNGFFSPFDKTISIKSKVKRAIPLKIQLMDSSNNIVTDTTIAGAAPVVSVSFIAQGGTASADATEDLLPVGQSNTANIFSFDAATQNWTYNLSSEPFGAAGTYIVTVKSGDETKYSISSTCSGSFVRQ